MKRGILTVLVLMIVAGAAIFLINSIFHNGLSARSKPTFIEKMMARDARHFAISDSARALQNPVPNTADNLHEAELHFADHCAICHGNDGGADTMMGRGLYPKPPDLRLPQTQKLSDGELFWIIENGVRFTGMPSFFSPGMQDESWKLVHFIRHLPHLTPEEQIEMEKYNPKGPADRQEEQQEDNFLDGGAPAPQPETHHPH
jgi:mono/diheme cytochrome c family protein